MKGSDPKSQALKMVAEVGELADAINKGDLDEANMELGDVIVTLILLAEMHGLSPALALQSAYEKISRREGKMINGVFVKSEDLVGL